MLHKSTQIEIEILTWLSCVRGDQRLRCLSPSSVLWSQMYSSKEDMCSPLVRSPSSSTSRRLLSLLYRFLSNRRHHARIALVLALCSCDFCLLRQCKIPKNPLFTELTKLDNWVRTVWIKRMFFWIFFWIYFK